MYTAEVCFCDLFSAVFFFGKVDVDGSRRCPTVVV